MVTTNESHDVHQQQGHDFGERRNSSSDLKSDYHADHKDTSDGRRNDGFLHSQHGVVPGGPRAAPAPPSLSHPPDSSHGPMVQQHMSSSVPAPHMPPGFDQRAIQGSTVASRAYYSTQMPLPGLGSQRQDGMLGDGQQIGGHSHSVPGPMHPSQMPSVQYPPGSMMGSASVQSNAQSASLTLPPHQQQMVPGQIPAQQGPMTPQQGISHSYDGQTQGMNAPGSHPGGYMSSQHHNPVPSPHQIPGSSGPVVTRPPADGRYSQILLAESMSAGGHMGGSPMTGSAGGHMTGMELTPLGGSQEGRDGQPLVLSRTAALAALGVDPGSWHNLSHVRRRVAVTGQVKKEICQLKEELGDVSQDEMVEQVFRKYQVRLSRTTVSKILKDADKWLKVSGVAAKQKRCRSAKFPDLEKSLALWYQQISAMHAPVSDAMIVDKARSLAMELSIAPEDFKVSDGWLYRFKRRHELPTARKRGLGQGPHMDDMKQHMYMDPSHQGYPQTWNMPPHGMHHPQHTPPPPHHHMSGMQAHHQQHNIPMADGAMSMMMRGQEHMGGPLNGNMQHQMQHQQDGYMEQAGVDDGNESESEEEDEEEEEMEIVEQVGSDQKKRSMWGASLSAADRERYEQVRSLFAGTLKKLETFPRL